jgi:cytoskeletal protein RodZ
MSKTQVKVEQQKNNDTQESVGLLLKNRREQKGHTVYEVAEALCLSSEIIKTLESDNFDSLPEPPYVRGYLRSYAKFTDIDSQKVISLYEAQRGADPQHLEYHFKPANTSHLAKPIISPTMLRLGLIAILLIALVSISMIPAVDNWMKETWEGFSKQTAEKNYAAANKDKDNPELVTNRFSPPAPLPSSTNTDGSINSKTLLKQDVDKDDSKNSSAGKIKDGQQTEDNKEMAVDETEGTKLKFVFNKEVWMRIKDKTKKTIFESLSPAGDEKEIKLKRPMTFRIGNAEGVEIYLEGKRFDITAFTTEKGVANFTIQ